MKFCATSIRRGFCKTHGYNFTTRLQILNWGNERRKIIMKTVLVYSGGMDSTTLLYKIIGGGIVFCV